MTHLSSNATQSLAEIVDEACQDQETGLPGAVVVVVGKNGQELFSHASGKRGYASADSMNLESVFWIASCTKLLVAIACMQLVEKDVLRLDDPDQIEGLCSELKEVKVLRDDGTLVEKTSRITLRMLLSHTAGFGYSFFNEKLRDYNQPIGYDEFSGHMYDMLQPLVRQPGEGWEYGINIDWAGIVVERVTGHSLNEYLEMNIFSPLGLQSMSMLPNASMKANLVHMSQRSPEGQLSRRDHILRRPLIAESEADQKTCFNSGGAGCFAKPQEYCHILATLLNDGTSPTTGQRLLRKETVDEMFRNQIPDFPNFGSQGIPASKADLTNPIPELYPSPTPQGWGLSFMLTGGQTGRSTGTAHWAGLPNLWWWCDRDQGIAGMICCQILPFADPQVTNLWVNVESTVYKSLS